MHTECTRVNHFQTRKNWFNWNIFCGGLNSLNTGTLAAPHTRPHPAKGRAGCWVPEGVATSRYESPEVSRRPPPREIFENSDAKSCILVTILAVKLLAFWKLLPRSWGTNTLLVPQPKSWGTSLPRSLRLLRLRLCLPDWFNGLSDHLIFLRCSTAGFVRMVC